MELVARGHTVQFDQVPLLFRGPTYTNAFALKNNKTLRETVHHPRYARLAKYIQANHSAHLDQPLGEFLLWLKNNGGSDYKKFLNPYGDLTYSTFTISNSHYLNKRGLYFYAVADQVMYVGRSRDSFGKRVNQGYGTIHPKNCYIDGQSTNCRLNGLITNNRCLGVTFYVHPMTDDEMIVNSERELIAHYTPPWNSHYAS